jgi:serine/threonine protein kinase
MTKMPPGKGFLGSRYLLRKRIAVGGQASVWTAWDSRLGRLVAVKILIPTHPARRASDDSKVLERFRREAIATAGLVHPNIAQVYDSGREGSAYYIVMEYLEGGSLRDLLSMRTLTAGEAAVVGSAVAKALEYAHSKGVLHRDIKPSNILFTSSGFPKLSDFGIARALSSSRWIGTASAGRATASAGHAELTDLGFAEHAPKKTGVSHEVATTDDRAAARARYSSGAGGPSAEADPSSSEDDRSRSEPGMSLSEGSGPSSGASGFSSERQTLPPGNKAYSSTNEVGIESKAAHTGTGLTKADAQDAASSSGASAAATDPEMENSIFLEHLFSGSPLTAAKSLVGTPAYMSPEQVQGLPLDERSDIYSLGLVLLESLTGQNPQANATSPNELLRRAQDLPEVATGLLKEVEGLSPRFSALVVSCLEPEPALRPAEAGQIARILAEFSGPRTEIDLARFSGSGSDLPSTPSVLESAQPLAPSTFDPTRSVLGSGDAVFDSDAFLQQDSPTLVDGRPSAAIAGTPAHAPGPGTAGLRGAGPGSSYSDYAEPESPLPVGSAGSRHLPHRRDPAARFRQSSETTSYFRKTGPLGRALATAFRFACASALVAAFFWLAYRAGISIAASAGKLATALRLQTGRMGAEVIVLSAGSLLRRTLFGTQQIGSDRAAWTDMSLGRSGVRHAHSLQVEQVPASRSRFAVPLVTPEGGRDGEAGRLLRFLRLRPSATPMIPCATSDTGAVNKAGVANTAAVHTAAVSTGAVHTGAVNKGAVNKGAVGRDFGDRARCHRGRQ